MTRISYSEEEDFPGQFQLWQANCHRSLQSKAGQAALKRLEAALVAMPEKALIRGKLVSHSGDVCAIGALARVEGKLPEPEPIVGDWEDDDVDDTAEFAEDNLDFPKLVAWKVVCENDEQDTVWELAHGPLKQHEPVYRGRDGKGYGIVHIRPVTPQERYDYVLRWVRRQIK